MSVPDWQISVQKFLKLVGHRVKPIFVRFGVFYWMRSNTTPVQRYRVVPFIGKLKNATTNPVESGYLEMQSPSGEKSMIQVFYDKTSGNVYIPQNAYVRYQQWRKDKEGEG